MIDFERFTDQLIDELKYEIGKDYDISLENYTKTNRSVTGITVKSSYSETAPVFSAEDLYDEYINGKSTSEIISMIKEVAGKSSHIDLSNLDKSDAMEHIQLSLLAYDKNADLLSKTPHESYADLAAVVRWNINDEMSFIVSNQFCQHLSMTYEEIFEMAHSKLESEPYSIRSMESIIIGAGYDNPVSGLNEPPIYVLTNSRGLNGANELLNPKAMHELQEILDDDFIILPSSRHEVICLKKDNAININELRNMVKTVNASSVDIRDQLSDNVYEYNSKSRSLQIAGQEQTIHKPVPSLQKSMSRGR